MYAPVSGKVIPLSQVEDKAFSSGMLGQGVAFIFEEELVCAPCDGEISLVLPSSHAFGMIGPDAIEVLVHIGFNTVDLNGEGFSVLVEKGKKVKKGTPIIKIDRNYMMNKNISLITPMTITNSSDFNVEIFSHQECEKGITEIALVKLL